MNRSRTVTAGLIISGLLGLSDVLTLPFGDGEHPPVAVAVVGAVLGVITLIGVGYGWRGRRGGIGAVIVTRLLSALSAVPALFVDGVPGGIRVLAAVGIAITLIGVALVAPALRTPAGMAVAS
jgi:hypothetical protein